MAGRGFSDDELRLYELLQQFLGLSDDKDVAGTIILIGPNGSIVGDATLSAADIDAAADALVKLNIARGDADHPAAGSVDADPLLDVDADDVADLIDEAEAFLANGGLA
ncbi:hypothetical protein AB0D12_31780 [Streptomyces sp. NPDC048479]|uniref:hypothetical protein n=1 Tax=Streptomyces sp. NPDC048479 TaxID=3154725 RepID=UPI00343415D2